MMILWSRAIKLEDLMILKYKIKFYKMIIGQPQMKFLGKIFKLKNLLKTANKKEFKNLKFKCQKKKSMFMSLN